VAKMCQRRSVKLGGALPEPCVVYRRTSRNSVARVGVLAKRSSEASAASSGL